MHVGVVRVLRRGTTVIYVNHWPFDFIIPEHFLEGSASDIVKCSIREAFG